MRVWILISVLLALLAGAIYVGYVGWNSTDVAMPNGRVGGYGARYLLHYWRRPHVSCRNSPLPKARDVLSRSLHLGPPSQPKKCPILVEHLMVYDDASFHLTSLPAPVLTTPPSPKKWP